VKELPQVLEVFSWTEVNKIFFATSGLLQIPATVIAWDDLMFVGIEELSYIGNVFVLQIGRNQI
jgi:hypothetical protein